MVLSSRSPLSRVSGQRWVLLPINLRQWLLGGLMDGSAQIGAKTQLDILGHAYYCFSAFVSQGIKNDLPQQTVKQEKISDALS